MSRLAANLSMLFTERPMLERVAAAARAGFEAVEVQFPYDHAVADWSRALRDAGLPLVLHNLPGGDWAAGERGIACLPGREAEFGAGVARAVAYASALGVPRLNCLAGVAPPDIDAEVLQATLIENLDFAAHALAEAGLELLIEPINRRDVPGFVIGHSAQGVAVLDALQARGHRNVRLQFDCYHAQRSEGELAGTLARLLPRIGHVQIADNPGRHEPGTGEINYRFLLAELDRLGYTGWIGCEYLPLTTTEAGLAWVGAAGLSLPGPAPSP